jgi:choline dehydrogenase-like flavoprotein
LAATGPRAYFTRLEADADFGDLPWHGDDGLLPITRYLDVELTEVAAAGLEALKAGGFPTVEDHNRTGAVAAGRMPMSSHDGIRVTTADAFLPVGGTPPNLAIRSGALVGDIVFDHARATGVRLLTAPSFKPVASCSARARTAPRRSSCDLAWGRPST